ncbi:SMI1/KNR4 family protein [Streptomyces sp. NPDC045431]|uniref:SMI1/KNR4 family protein n=1 Tax=Streptomyces sp. NPDC045431 TaxID=3155613 RepID=UPI0033E52ADE
MTPHVERLAEVIPPPAASEPKNWPEVEATLGSKLPRDYKDLVEAFGGGVFDDAVWLLEPHCAHPSYDLLKENAGGRRGALERSGSKPPELDEEGSDVITWALTEDGATLYWLVRPGQEPDDWTVMVNEGRGPDWERFPMSCTAFLEGILVTGEIESDILHDLPADGHGFRPSSDFL